MIKIKAIIERQGLEMNDVAKQLFPQHKHPRLALNRVMSGESFLDSNQLSKFALLTGLTISELFTGENWKSKTKEGIHVFTNGSFRAELDPKTWITKIFHWDSIFHESIIHSGSTLLSEYLMELENIIQNNQKQTV